MAIQSDVGEGLGIQVSDNPTTSCVQIVNIQRASSCFYKCLTYLNSPHMCSYNKVDEMSPCPEGYTTYNYTYFEICLMYVPVNSKYPDAVENCKENGGDLIKIDSLEKYDIFKSFSGQYTGNGPIQVWVQGVKDNNQWRFHDGSLMPGHCLASQLDGLNEIYMRARSDLDFRCYDDSFYRKHHYVCEIYRLFPVFR
ncbi:uncharacterized protein LOC134264654 [Saccostrea cucullata]|uniref:uncharacterized protein LOC134264654 n=1 Tax=Saccostrea cuccullata TaxID=36930 RepID=UPI002ED3E9B1